MTLVARIWAISLNTFREASRKRSVYAILVLVVMANGGALLLGQASLHEEVRVAKDAGMAAMSFFGSVAAMVLGVQLLHAELTKRTVHTILAKPLSRWEFVVGKYLGMALTLALMVAVFAAALAGLLKLQQAEIDASVLKAVALAGMEVFIVAALAVFFSSFSSPILSGVFTCALWVMGRITPEIVYAAKRAKSETIRVVARLALKLVPDLNLYAISGGDLEGKHVSLHGEFVTWSYVGTAGLYALAWIGFFLLFASANFQRRDFV